MKHAWPASIPDVCSSIADEIEPRFRSMGRSYSCTGYVGKRWGAAYEAAEKAIRRALDTAAGVCDRRAEQRFAEFGVTEPDTNASYYDGSRAEALDELDEEDWALAAAIRALKPAD